MDKRKFLKSLLSIIPAVVIGKSIKIPDELGEKKIDICSNVKAYPLPSSGCCSYSGSRPKRIILVKRNRK